MLFRSKGIKKGCLLNYNVDNSEYFDKILEKYKLHYTKNLDVRKKSYIYCISKKKIKKDLYLNGRQINGKEMGIFLGYLCVHDISKENPCEKGYALDIVYNDGKTHSSIYAYCCLNLTLEIIIKQIKIVRKMNKLLKKYLSNELKGEILLELS